MEPTAPTPASRPGDVPPDGGGKPWPAIILGVLAAILAVVLIVVLASDDDDEDVTTDSTTTTEQTTTTTEATTTTEEESTTTTEATTTTTEAGGLPDAEAANVVWPAPGDDAYDDPMPAVEAFAEDVLGFVDPTYGEFMQGDARSGEVEVRALPESPVVTTIGVRQMSDDAWYVLFAATSEVELTEPTAGSAIDTPLQVAGQSRSFEGQVRIAVFERGDTEPLGEDFVTGGSGEALEPFTGEIDWDNPGGGWGVVVASTEGGPDGTTWAATAIPVGFIGGD